MNGEDFRHRAECRDADAELFFPVADSGPDYDAQVQAAKAVCAVCPVRAECLSWALVMCISARKRCFEQGIRVEDMSFSWPVAAPPWSFCVKDTSGPDVHDGPGSSAGATSTTSKTCPGEIHITLDALPYGIAGGLTEDERRRERAVRPRDSRRRPILRPATGSPTEITAAGRAAIRSGASVREVADEFGVSLRTAIRWAAQARTPESGRARTTAGSAGCNRAPRQISTTHNAQAGTRTKEEADPR